jgi:hypothetical protein
MLLRMDTMLNGQTAIRSGKVQIKRRSYLNLVLVLHALQLVKLGILRQRCPLQKITKLKIDIEKK